MKWLARQIFTPLSYLRIKQGSGALKSKVTIDWVAPAILASATVTVLHALPFNVDLLGDAGLVTQFLGLLQLMAAFFIAALAAVATFERPGLDDKMKGEAATLWRYRKSAREQVEHVLSWREFICYLFGYLSFASLSFFIIINFARFIAPTANLMMIDCCPFLLLVVSLLLQVVFFLFFWQLVVTMFYGIYFLCDRLQVMNDPDI